mgnify:CR=1 FL=1
MPRSISCCIHGCNVLCGGVATLACSHLQLGSDLKEAGEAESEDEEREEESEEESLGYIQAEDGGRGGGWDDDKDVEDAEYLAALARRVS